REVASRVQVVCTCVVDSGALENLALGEQGFLEAIQAGGLWIDFSTISPEAARSFALLAAARGVSFIDAPVTGSKLGAEKGTLVIMVGASVEDFDRAQPVFRAIGERAIHVGPVGAGSQIKLAGNALIALMLQGLSEGMLLTQRAGIDVRTLLEV